MMWNRYHDYMCNDLNVNGWYYRFVCVSHSMLSVFICACIAASALGQVAKEQVGVFFPHIFNQSASVYICICIEQRDAECQRWDFEKHFLFFLFQIETRVGGWKAG